MPESAIFIFPSRQGILFSEISDAAFPKAMLITLVKSFDRCYVRSRATRCLEGQRGRSRMNVTRDGGTRGCQKHE